MIRRVHRSIALAVALLATVAVARAQTTTDTPDQLQTLVAPIALYPDALVASILPASTYPVQIVEAERIVSQGTPSQDDLSQWDPSIQALASHAPSVLKMMNDRLSWTTELGQQVAQNQGAVMQAVQQVRAKAQAAGNLASNNRQTVTTQNDTIIIQPTDPQVIYVPQYDPVAIFSPPPVWGYYPPGYGVLSFGVGFSAGFFAGYACDWGGWHGGYSHITINNNYYHRNTNIVNSNVNDSRTRWTPPSDPGRIRRGDGGGGYGNTQRTLGSDDRLGGRGFDAGGDGRGWGAGVDDPDRRADGGGFGGGRDGSWGAFHGAGGDGWNQRAYSDRGDRSFGGGGFGGGWGGGFGRGGGFGGGGGFGRGGGFGGGGRGRR